MSKVIRHKRSWLHLFRVNRYDYYECDDGTRKIVYDDGYQVIKANNGHCVIVALPDGRRYTNSTRHENKEAKLLKHRRVWRHNYDYYEYDDGTRKTVYDDGYQIIRTYIVDPYFTHITCILPDGRRHTNDWKNEYWPPTSCWTREE